MKPRYKPSWVGSAGETGQEKFLGHAGGLDLWLSGTYVYFVGPRRRKIRKSPYNFDGYKVENNRTLVSVDRRPDLHVELYELCEAYRLCIDHGIIIESEA